MAKFVFSLVCDGAVYERLIRSYESYDAALEHNLDVFQWPTAPPEAQWEIREVDDDHS